MVSSLWYLEEFCDSQHSNFEDWGVLPQTSQDFLRNLHLPQIHPFCSNNADDDDALIFPNAPAMGPYKEPFFFSRSHVGFLQDLMESLVTLWYFYIPPSAAFIQLWILLLAGYIAAVGLAYLAWRRWCRCRCRCRWKQKHNASAITVVTIVAAWVIMTDDQYVRIGSFGRLYGLFFMVGTIVLTLPVRPVLLAFLFFSLGLIFPWSSDDPEEIHNNIYPGLYYNPRIAFMDRMVQVWDVPEYSQITTPWQLTGDARTAFPYLMNNLKKQPKFHRVWQPTVDGEYVALDIAFPKTGHDSSQPLYLILHGLNGGSEEGYVLDFTESRIEKRSTVVVLVARGLMDTPIQGWTVSEKTSLAVACPAVV